MVKVGRYARMGKGSRKCVHCGTSRGDNVVNTGFFTSRNDLLKHLNTQKCRKSRGYTSEFNSPKDVIGENLYYEINHPDCRLLRKNNSGKEESVFSCPKCSAQIVYHNRYQHVLKCYPKHGISFPRSVSNES